MRDVGYQTGQKYFIILNIQGLLTGENRLDNLIMRRSMYLLRRDKKQTADLSHQNK